VQTTWNFRIGRWKNFICLLIVFSRDGLGQKSLQSKRFYKNHRDTAEKTSKNVFKSLNSTKMCLRSLNFSEKIFNNNWNLYKSPKFLNRCLYFSGNVLILNLKKPPLLWKWFQKASNCFKMPHINKKLHWFLCKSLTSLKKALITFKMSS
jgi:hypothetical protein